MENIVREGIISRITCSKNRESWTVYFRDKDHTIVSGLDAMKKMAQEFNIDTDSEDFHAKLIGKHIHFTTTIFNIMEKFATAEAMKNTWIRIHAVTLGISGEIETD